MIMRVLWFSYFRCSCSHHLELSSSSHSSQFSIFGFRLQLKTFLYKSTFDPF